MKSDVELEAMPMRLRVGWQAADLIAAHNLAVTQMLLAAVAAGRNERLKAEGPGAPPPSPSSIQSKPLEREEPS